MKKLLALCLSASMLASMLCAPVSARNGESAPERSTGIAEKLPERQAGRLLKSPDSGKFEIPAENPNERIEVLVELEGPCLLDLYNRGGAAPFSLGESREPLGEFLSSPDAADYARALEEEQQAMLSELTALENRPMLMSSRSRPLGQWNILLNGFSMYTTRKMLPELRAVPGVREVTEFIPIKAPTPSKSRLPATEENFNLSSLEMTGVDRAWQEGWTGKGRVIAIVDTEFDVGSRAPGDRELTHEVFRDDSFLTQGDALDASLRHTAGSIREQAEQFNLHAEHDPDSTEYFYRSRKVPFAYDYAENDMDLSGGYVHGSHVAGIAAGLCRSEDGTVRFSGVAPDAQLLLMKVAGNSGIMFPRTILDAMEDALILGADAVNLSLGSNQAFPIPGMEEVFRRLTDAGVTVGHAAGNEESSARGNSFGGRLPTYHPSMQSADTDSTVGGAISVASADNVYSVKPPCVLWKTGGQSEFSVVDGLDGDHGVPVSQLEGQELTLLDAGLGTQEEFEDLSVPAGPFAALAQRGELTFELKARNAQNIGASALIIYNNKPDEIIGIMGLKDKGITIPVIMISNTDGTAIRSALLGGEEVTVTSQDRSGWLEREPERASRFSSMGPSGRLELCPDLAVPGGRIYSSVPGLESGAGSDYRGDYDTYEGTSMAAPHFVGLSVLLRQRLSQKFGMESGRAAAKLADSLLVSTAAPMRDDRGVFYSPRVQGAGLANGAAALATPAYLTAEGERTGKLSLGDDPEKTGVFPLAYTVHNLSDRTLTYELHTTVLVPEVSEEDGVLLHGRSERVLKELPGGLVTVAPGGEQRVEETVALSVEERAELSRLFPNGTFVEGYSVLTGQEGEPDLCLPFMGFFGDWTAIPKGEVTGWLDPEEEQAAVPWTPYYGGDGSTGQPLGTNLMAADGEQAVYYGENLFISPNGDGKMDGPVTPVIPMLQGAQLAFVDVTAADDPDYHYYSGWESNLNYSMLENNVPTMPTVYSEAMRWDGVDQNTGEPAPDGTRCRFEVTLVGLSDAPVPAEKNLTYEAYVEQYGAPTLFGREAVPQIIEFPVAVDLSEPYLLESEFSTHKAEERTLLTFTAMDPEGALSGWGVAPIDANARPDFSSPYAREELIMSPGCTEKEITLDVTELRQTGVWDGQLYVELNDYAGNSAAFTIQVALPDEPIRREAEAYHLYVGEEQDLYLWGEEPKSWTVDRPEVATVENGFAKALAPGQATITLLVDQFELTYVLAVEERETALEDFTLLPAKVDGIRQNGEIPLLVDGLEPGTTLPGEPELTVPEEYAGLFTLEKREEFPGLFLCMHRESPSPAGHTTLTVTLGGVTKPLEVSWERWDGSGELLPDVPSRQVIFLRPGQERELSARLGEMYGPFTWSIADGPGALTASEKTDSGRGGVVSIGRFRAGAPGVTHIRAASGTEEILEYTILTVPREGTADLEEEKLTLRVGEEAALRLTDESTKEILWTSFDESVARVDGTGTVTGLAPGYAVIKAAPRADPQNFDICLVRVKPSLKPDPPVPPVVPEIPEEGGYEEPMSGVEHSVRNPNGSVTTVEKRPDGTCVTTTRGKDGTVTQTVRTPDGESRTAVTLPDSGRREKPREIPMEPVDGGELTFRIKGRSPVAVTVPVEGLTPGTVPVRLLPDGREEVLRESFSGEGSVTFLAGEGDRITFVRRGADFADVRPGDWFREAVDFAFARELFAGVGGGLFAPNVPMTRAMLVQVLYELEGEMAGEGASPFTDVPREAWYAKAVDWAFAEKLISGYPDGSFRGDEPITREQLALILHHLLGSPAPRGEKLPFLDGEQVSPYALESVQWAVENRLMSGDGQLLSPGGTATRAQTAAMLMNLVKLMLHLR